MREALGYFRDFVAAVLGVLMITGLMTQELAGGILLVFVTGAAFGVHMYSIYQGRKNEASNEKRMGG